ncbi:MAG: cation:proton antiporter [Desulfobacteraceae bacterium]|jgi:Kef-type K+ transport system membrane component KefB
MDCSLVVFLVGGIVLCNMLIKTVLSRTGVPALVGYLLLGLLLRGVDHQAGFLSPACLEVLGFLEKMGLVVLLFKVGLESDLKGLLKQLRSASFVWFGDVTISGVAGFAACYYVLGLGWVTALTVATAFTATSVGISVAVWESHGALNSPDGQLLVDVAELDDISAVVLMSLLFSVLGTLQTDGPVSLLHTVPKVVGLFSFKLVGFGLGCFLFSRYLERPISQAFKKAKSPPDHMLVVVSFGFLIAAAADALGFSLAIGAFFAGLVFSRDPEAVKEEASFTPLYELFCPFFFIGVGLDIDPATLSSGLTLGAVLLIFAVASKLVADGVPVWFLSGPQSGVRIGMSMIPRAEISMVILQRGLAMGDWVIPPRVFSGMVLVSALTCLVGPVAVSALLKRFPKG